MPAYHNASAVFQNQSWHNESIVFNEPLTAEEAMILCGMNYEYSLQQNYSIYNEKLADGSQVEIARSPANTNTLWRGPRGDEGPIALRTVGSRYTVIQNMDMARLVNPIVADFPVETVGVVNNWQTTFVTLMMEPFDVGGYDSEAHTARLMISDDKRKPGAAFWSEVYNRVVCANTYAQAMRGAKEIHRIPHNSNVQDEIGFRVEMVAFALAERQKTIEQFNTMIKSKITEQQAAEIFGIAFPMKMREDVRQINLIEAVPVGAEGMYIDRMAVQADVKEAWLDKRNEFINKQRTETELAYKQFNDEFPYAAQTAYAALQAVTWQTNHSDLYRDGKDQVQGWSAVMLGDRRDNANAAFGAALKFAN